MFGSCDEGLACLVVYSEGVQSDSVAPKERNGCFEGDGSVFGPKTGEWLQVDITSPHSDLEITGAR